MPKLDRDARRAALLTSALFRAMKPPELETVLDLAVERRFRRNQMIFQKEEEGSSMMAVLIGRVRISAVSADGKEVTLNVIKQGEVFGEIALLDGKPRSAAATAAEETVLLVLERRDFLPMLAANPDLAQRLLVVVCDKLRRASLALEDFALLDLPERLARLLVNLAEEYGRHTAAGIIIDVRMSQRDLSTWVASSRESINKQLKAWRDEGVVELEAGLIILRQPDVLRGLTRSPGEREV
jgi:CRP/FNR family transcriptional regulator, cyclic AMP receptor protein